MKVKGHKTRAWALLLVGAVLLSAVGCGEEENPAAIIDDDPSLGPFPESADLLMANFQAAYETRNFDALRILLAPEFETHLQAATTEEFPDVGETLELAEELRIHERMFSGDALTDPNGDYVPGVESISFLGFKRTQEWTVSGPDDAIIGVEWAPFDVNILLDRGERYSFLRTEGTIKFYVTSRDSVHRGSTKKYYQMVGQVDWTGPGKSTEEERWGSIKALFR